MKCFAVVGWVFQGTMYCAEHKPQGDEEEIQPVFAEHATTEDICDECHEQLMYDSLLDSEADR